MIPRPNEVLEIKKKCPYCSAANLARVPRGVFVKTFVPWLPLKKYICYSCLKTFYKLNK